MSWEAGNNSVRYPRTHTTTPQGTPRLGEFEGDLYITPRLHKEALDSSGWTPIFAEDYTVFNATPGRLTNNKPTFDTATLSGDLILEHKRQQSTAESLVRGTSAAIFGEGEDRGLTSPRVTESSSGSHLTTPARTNILQVEAAEIAVRKTPTKSPKHPDEPFIGQIVTPPQSSHKHTRRNSEVDARSKMQNEQDYYSHSGTMGTGYDLSFATPTNVDLFSFPMDGPATAPAYMNSKSFWDPGSSMGDMSMDFTGDPFAASGDWAQSANLFQQAPISSPHMQQNNAQQARRPRPLLAKPPTSSMPQTQSQGAFDFGMTSLSEDPFGPSATGAVNPNLLFSFPDMTPPTSNSPFSASQGQLSPAFPTHLAQALQSPLDVQRPQSVHSQRPVSRNRPMLRPVSPLKSNRTSGQRSTSDNLKRPPALKPAAVLPNDAQPPPNFAGKGKYSSGIANASTTGRLSPTKQGSRTNLQAIPETKLFNPKTSVTFSIDANGRARTETTVVMERFDEDGLRRGGSRHSGQSASPMSGSDTDEEPIMIPSRNPSFHIGAMQNDRGRAMPKVARFDTQIKQYPRSRKLSAGNVRTLPRTPVDEESDEDGTVDTARRSGDAAKALRKVMESRRRSVSGITSMPPSSQTSTIRLHSGVMGTRDKERQHRRQSYASSSTFSASTPSTVTDLDLDVEMCDTPSTVASESTRCVCHRKEREGDEFMIQCESCEHWQHSTCVKINPRELPKVYICAFCAQTPNMRGGRVRERATVVLDSPLGRKTHR